MDSLSVLKIYKKLTSKGIRLWLDGGWGVDALVGSQTRVHDDLDIVIESKNESLLLKFLEAEGYLKITSDDQRPWNYVLKNKDNKKIDVHIIDLDEHGNGRYGPKENGVYYPASSLKGSGYIENHKVCCLSAEYQVVSHTGYKLCEKDYKDVLKLCELYELEIPPEYQKFAKNGTDIN